MREEVGEYNGLSVLNDNPTSRDAQEVCQKRAQVQEEKENSQSEGADAGVRQKRRGVRWK